jgi:uncharacterized protein
MRIYYDTSALAKAYASETGSADVDDFLSRASVNYLSELNRVELRCMLARRMRSGEIDAVQEHAVWSQFELDIAAEHFDVLPVPPAAWAVAREMIERVTPIALRTLDALHVAIASTIPSVTFVTADRAQRDAALALGIETIGIALAQS